ncbi:uncharacterized protein K452DRAFT_117332 [Aplosporella prunicola CBS 121167]|uniref:Uncharacterized protein n=1 Tax=Aplosporella prunicola CBS 121167 TaxID=1176127 RepID=A0A6A6AZY6_9PEZI|nr:uncharacterized protein K452DRAFT_117332 [Aplosporella prunicola CBS 121167]KAF2136838.1 hypothetical protein K452DRAFT_117332 [Aplosporella prunicola CBS 121167]
MAWRKRKRRKKENKYGESRSLTASVVRCASDPRSRATAYPAVPARAATGALLWLSPEWPAAGNIRSTLASWGNAESILCEVNHVLRTFNPGYNRPAGRHLHTLNNKAFIAAGQRTVLTSLDCSIRPWNWMYIQPPISLGDKCAKYKVPKTSPLHEASKRPNGLILHSLAAP